MKLLKLHPHHICTSYLKSLIHIVPCYKHGDDTVKYYIRQFTLGLYSELLGEQ